jgi:hypothetical protein
MSPVSIQPEPDVKRVSWDGKIAGQKMPGQTLFDEAILSLQRCPEVA